MSISTAANPAMPILALNGGDLRQQATSFLRDAVDWVGSHWLHILIATGIGIGIVVLLHVIRSIGLKMCQRGDGTAGWSAIIGRAVAKTGNFFIVMTAARLVVGYASAPEAIFGTVRVLFTIASTFQAAIWLREFILGVVEHRTQSETYAGEALGSALGIIRLLVTIVLFSIAVIVVLSNIGVNVTGLVAGLGIGGIAIGLAAQGIFADLFAALSILFDRPFKRGDSVSYDSTTGAIEQIGLKSTRIRSFTGEQRIISNRNLLDKEIINNTDRGYRRGKFAIGVIYQTPPEVALRIPAILKELVEAAEMEFVRSAFTGFGDSSLDFELEFDSPSPDYTTFYDNRGALGLAILKRFNDEGIEFAYPTQTTFTSAPDGRMILPYPEVQPVMRVDKGKGEE